MIFFTSYMYIYFGCMYNARTTVHMGTSLSRKIEKITYYNYFMDIINKLNGKRKCM